jgi:hypothetical protein
MYMIIMAIRNNISLMGNGNSWEFFGYGIMGWQTGIIVVK